MPIRPYWCANGVFRGCILREVFTALGASVLLPKAISKKGVASKKGAAFRLSEVSALLASRGCSELANVDRAKGVGTGTGDIDFAALFPSDVLYVAEVKTRIALKWVSKPDVLELMLQYHLDEPGKALEAWNRLERLGVVKPGYDNPASIPELTRLVVGAYLKAVKGELRCAGSCKLVIGLVTLSYVARLVKEVTRFVANTYEYLKSCNLPVAGYATVILCPRLGNDLKPEMVEVACLGPSCKDLGLESAATVRLAWRSCPKGLRVLGCGECRYRRYCLSAGLLVQRCRELNALGLEGAVR